MRSVICRFVVAIPSAVRTIRILFLNVMSTVVTVRVDTRIKLVGNVCVMRTVVRRVLCGPSMTRIGVVTGIELVCCVGAVRAVVCRARSVMLCECGAVV